MPEPRFKKYILFAMPTYYPGGGLSDIVGSFDTLDEAKQAGAAQIDWWYVVDRDTWDYAAEGD